jgi:hypothetical protein
MEAAIGAAGLAFRPINVAVAATLPLDLIVVVSLDRHFLAESDSAEHSAGEDGDSE